MTQQQVTENPMRKIYLQKVVLNMGVGRSGDAIDIAKKALDQISGKKSCSREAKETQRDWGVRKGEPIGVAVTVRENDAKDLLKRLLEAKGNKIKGRSFDGFCSISFGISEHIDIPGVKYDPQIGILGLDVAITLARPGFSVRTRSKHKSRIGKKHHISKQEAVDFLVKEFGVVVV
ncbi:MAG: 50S ribosomal protein L5 [Nitrosopumilaceae archaeon]|nr:50S ribosomal protein L5 [Nitrosopumilaceae archaeon]NIU02523.1 50S ribosomal protein L5 [Nitrosopumilaceae archaeon]NIU88984.1 50S ribosomal protein L5 [Nitrosopumilaceae archaeon]NIV67095.1 50S ribosomal protein L5 [Nitrosopumilaceae archaeon]NIX63124.1 50S ribosomal protein L5 [Nitrosopumilaceae archaeon]